MIERLYLRELLSFKEVELEFDSGLIVFSGPSGAGKSILIQAILANFGIGNSEAKLCEIELLKLDSMQSDEFLLENPLVIRALRKERSRYYLNKQQISKRRLGEILTPYCSYLSVREHGVFESQYLLNMLDSVLITKNIDIKKLYEEFKKRYKIYHSKKDELKELQENKKRLIEKKEFIRFEINKIVDIEPKDGEYEELLLIKQRLSYLDRLQEAIQQASNIFDLEESVQEILNLMQKDSSYFTDAMNHLRADFEDIEALREELSEINIEDVLNRLETLSSLISRYGSIKEALEYKDLKEKELLSYEHIEQDCSNLESFVEKEENALIKLAKEISKYRHKLAKFLEDELHPILERLKLPDISFKFSESNLSNLGIERVDIILDGSKSSTLSGGEFNRLRLALMSVTLSSNSSKGGIIFLDEIDANVSGDESIAIAEMIEELAKSYQIFAISHQAHLSARANQHILVYKENNISIAKILDESERIKELARIVAGEEADKEVLNFVQKLRFTYTKKRRN